eukprot:1761503-Rhodomonas_salina.2
MKERRQCAKGHWDTYHVEQEGEEEAEELGEEEEVKHNPDGQRNFQSADELLFGGGGGGLGILKRNLCPFCTTAFSHSYVHAVDTDLPHPDRVSKDPHDQIFGACTHRAG